MLCQDCSIKSTCVTPCGELSKDLKSITTPRQHPTVSDIHYSQAFTWEPIAQLNDNDWAVVEESNLTRKQKRYLYAYYWDRLTQQAICDKYGVSQQAVSFTLANARKRLWKKLV